MYRRTLKDFDAVSVIYDSEINKKSVDAATLTSAYKSLGIVNPVQSSNKTYKSASKPKNKNIQIEQTHTRRILKKAGFNFTQYIAYPSANEKIITDVYDGKTHTIKFRQNMWYVFHNDDLYKPIACCISVAELVDILKKYNLN